MAGPDYLSLRLDASEMQITYPKVYERYSKDGPRLERGITTSTTDFVNNRMELLTIAIVGDISLLWVVTE